MNEKLKDCIKDIAITRPNATTGFWLLFLLPLSLIISAAKHEPILTPTYKLVSIFSIGLLFSSSTFLYYTTKKNFKVLNVGNLCTGIFTSVLFHTCFGRGFSFSLFSGLFSTVIYIKLYKIILRTFPSCFTFGEAAIVTQALALLLYTTVVNIINAIEVTPRTAMQISTLILQIGLIGIGIISVFTYKFEINNSRMFYIIFLVSLVILIILPLHNLLRVSPLLWILAKIFEDLNTLKLVLYWSICSGIAVLATSRQITSAKKASTSIRKVFHILAVLAFIPGLLYKCSMLYLASGVALGIFLTLELIRILDIPPLGIQLRDMFIVFSDIKDAGILALTPIYLLAGCSIPLWIHPAPCDVTDSAVFNLLPLLSGLLTIGIGDTAASIVGSNFGRYQWKDSSKTIEGTLGCILSQLGVFYVLVYFEWLHHLVSLDYIKIVSAIFISSVIEAKTSQIDNLVLPLIMYIILI